MNLEEGTELAPVLETLAERGIKLRLTPEGKLQARGGKLTDEEKATVSRYREKAPGLLDDALYEKTGIMQNERQVRELAREYFGGGEGSTS